MRKINLSRYLLLIVCFVIVSCNLKKNYSLQNNQKLPDSYGISADKDSLSVISWKEYFKDSLLISLIYEALNNNIDLRQALPRIQYSQSELLANKGVMFPNLSRNIGSANRKYGLYTMDGAGNSTTPIAEYKLPGKLVPTYLSDYLLSFQASWEVDILGKLNAKRKASAYRYLSTIQGINWLKTNLITKVAALYYDLQALDSELSIIEETIKLQEEALEIVKLQKNIGATNELAVKQFKSQVLSSKSMKWEIVQQIVEVENELNYTLGRFPQKIERPKVEMLNPIANNFKLGVPSQLLENRADIKQAELDLKACDLDVKNAKLAFYPSLNITGLLGLQSFKTKFLFDMPQSLTTGIVGNLTSPLINKSAIRANFMVQKASQVEALCAYQKAVLNGFVEVNTQMAQVNNLKKVYDNRAEEVQVLNNAIETSAELFRSGRATYVEILLTQRTALQAKMELIETQKRQKIASLNLYKALGGGWK